MIRRSFLQLSAHLSLALASPALARTGPVDAPDVQGATDELAVQLAGLFADPEVPRAIGRRFLAAYPDEYAGARYLLRSLERQHPENRQELAQALRRQREEDFRQGDTVIVEGWVLARSEARMCALTTIQAGARNVA